MERDKRKNDDKNMINGNKYFIFRFAERKSQKKSKNNGREIHPLISL